MEQLTVLYDPRCGLCRRARLWLESQPKHVSLEFIAAGSSEARQRYPDLDQGSTLRDLTVVGAGGELYQSEKAWLMCLWALREHRSLALRLSSPELMPFARRLISWISRNRLRLGELVG